MPCLVILVFLLLGVLAITTFSLPLREQARQRKYFLRQLATRLGGLYVSGNLLTSPAIRLRYAETGVTITPLGSIFGPPDSTGSLLLRLAWPAAPVQFEIQAIAPDTRPGLFGSWAGRLLTFESGPLSRQFRITARDAEWTVRACLTEPVQIEIARLAALSPESRLRIEVARRTMYIERHADSQDLDVSRAEDFVRQCLRLYDQVRLACTVGVTFVDQQTARVLEDAACPICGEFVHTNLVFCRRCMTVHHAECWTYNGRCATYGCGETQFQCPSQARIVPDS